MKISKHIVSASLVILFSTTGCNDFLDKAPLDELTESTAFITYDNFKTYELDTWTSSWLNGMLIPFSSKAVLTSSCSL